MILLSLGVCIRVDPNILHTSYYHKVAMHNLTTNSKRLPALKLWSNMDLT